MSYVIAVPEMLASAAADVATIGSSLSAAHAAAASSTTGIVAAAEDEVSAAVASVFSGHAQAFQGLARQAAAFHDQFVQTLTGGAGAYQGTEAVAAASLQHAAPAAGITPAILQSDLAILAAEPILIPIALFALGFIGLVIVFAAAQYFLYNLGIVPGG